MGTITVTNLGKAYKQYPTRWARLAEWVDMRGKPRHHLHWVLKDINFTVTPGEAVGIIGINGAGKSTLLKMITGTTQPTTGSVHIAGRVAALLELGMGFHPDFTGRQNAFMAGQLLGYTVEDIARLMPEIEAFAEIGDYIDQPVRVYSSGMQMRLAFSVATAHRPDVLIVDEALSVGDAYFQHKSFERIREFGRQGTTLLLVSHDRQAIQSICRRAILLDTGRIVHEGEPESVMDYYNALLADRTAESVSQSRREDGRVQTTSGTGEVVLDGIQMLNEQDEPIASVNVGQRVKLQITVRAVQNVDVMVVGYLIKDRLGQHVFGTNTRYLRSEVTPPATGESKTLTFDFQMNLGEGSYSVAVAVHAAETHMGRNYEWRDYALMFDVVNYDKRGFIGLAWLPPTRVDLSQ